MIKFYWIEELIHYAAGFANLFMKMDEKNPC